MIQNRVLKFYLIYIRQHFLKILQNFLKNTLNMEKNIILYKHVLLIKNN